MMYTSYTLNLDISNIVSKSSWLMEYESMKFTTFSTASSWWLYSENIFTTNFTCNSVIITKERTSNLGQHSYWMGQLLRKKSKVVQSQCRPETFKKHNNEAPLLRSKTTFFYTHHSWNYTREAAYRPEH